MSNATNKPLGTYRYLVAIETDATRYHGETPRRPRLLSANDADQLLAHLAVDLGKLLPPLQQCSIAAAGALFDQTQLLRPGFPVFTALEQLANQAQAGGRSGLVSLGSKDGRMPVSALQPENDIPLGLLQILPMVISGPAELIETVGSEMEHRFIEQGQISAHTASWMENAFAIKLNHARLMTLTDLNAMFRLQLEHFGFLTLWELLDAALTGREQALERTMQNGQTIRWQDGAVHTEFETFDHWAHAGGGQHLESVRGKLAGGYADWTRITRQYLTTLRAHGVDMVFSLPDAARQTITGTYFIEDSPRPPAANSAAVTEHSFAELGTVCVTVVEDGKQENYYPVSAQGLNDIHRAIQARGLGDKTVAYPGSILYDETDRFLVAEPVTGPQRH